MTPEIYLVKIAGPICDDDFCYLLDFVCDRKKEQILKQRKKQKADNMLIGGILAKTMIKKTFGIDEQIFAYGEHGKPYLLNYPDAHFNISHSGECVACAVLDKAVGVDVQKIGEYKPDVARKVCNADELAKIEESIDMASEFTRIWTQKEAVLKKYGTGIACSDIKNCIKNENVLSQKIDDYWISISF